jgi:hypothetical protein
VENKGSTAETRDKKKQSGRTVRYFIGGLIVGAILSPVLLFSFGHTTTTANAERMARDAANRAEAMVITPYCVANFNKSPDAKANMAALEKTNHWERGTFISEGGWAQAPDGSGRGSLVANACADKLLADAKSVAENSK